MTKLALLVLATTVAGAFASSAMADDKACLDAATKGQRFRDTHKLLEARDQLRICAAASCPTVVQSDCAGWLASVERALPSIVVTARDSTGTSLIDVKVTVDEQPFLARLEGRAVSIDPGPHTFRFEGPGGATLEQVVVAAEGEQNQRVAVVLGKKAATTTEPGPARERPPEPQPQPASDGSARSAGTAGAAPGEAGSASGGTTTPPDRGGSRGGSPWKTVGWVAAGAGVVGLGLGAVFGMMAIGDLNQAQCNPNHVCFTGPLNDARSAAAVSSVGFVAGGVLAAAGVGLVLFAPSRSGGGGEGQAGAAAVLSPVLARDGGGLRLGGSW